MFQPNDFQIRSSVYPRSPRPGRRLRWFDRLVIYAVILAGIGVISAILAIVFIFAWGRIWH